MALERDKPVSIVPQGARDLAHWDAKWDCEKINGINRINDGAERRDERGKAGIVSTPS